MDKAAAEIEETPSTTPDQPSRQASLPPTESEPIVGSKPAKKFYLGPRWLVLIPALIVFLFFLPTVRFQLVWDDTIFLSDMPTYRNPDLWPTALFKPFVLSPNYFRPLALLTFIAELQAAGQNPTLFHLTNILLQSINATLISLLAYYLLRTTRSGSSSDTPRDILLPIAAGLLYGLHPALIEGVAFVSSRFDLLMTTFLLLVLLADTTIQNPKWHPVTVGLLFLLAALSKEMAVALIVALPCWHLALSKERSIMAVLKANWPTYLAVGVGGLAYLGIRIASLGYLLTANDKAIPTGNFVQHALLFFKSLGMYVWLVIWPFTSLTPIHFSTLPVPTSSAAAWIALLFDLSIIAGVVWLIRHDRRTGWLTMAGLLALLPVVNLVPLELSGGAFIAERFLLFPMVFFALAVVAILARFFTGQSRRNKILSAIPFGLAGLFLIGSIAILQLTLPYWHDDLNLWTWALERAPRSATPPTNLSLQYTNRGLYEVGLSFANQAIRLDPNNADAHDNAGLALFLQENYTEAQAAFEKAIELEPQSALYWNNLAGALREQDKLAEAAQAMLEHAFKLDPNLPIGYLNMGIIYLKADRPDLAAGFLQQAVSLLPPSMVANAQEFLKQSQEPDRWLRLGNVLLQNNEFEGAARAFDQAATLGASVAEAGYGLSTALIQLKDWENAINVLNTSIQAAPDDARLYNNLGIVARETGDLAKAVEFFQKAIELAPDWEEPLKNLEGLGE